MKHIYKGPRTMGLPISGGRQVRPNRRFLPESKAGCECSQELPPQSDEEHSETGEDHTGRLCSIPSSGAGDEGRWGTSAASEGTIQPIFE